MEHINGRTPAAGIAALLERYAFAGWHPYFWIALIIAALYAKTLAFGFTWFDDDTLILKNLTYFRDWSHAAEIFGRNVFLGNGMPYYRPLLTLWFMVQSAWFGAAPLGYHLTAVMMHAVAGCLLFAAMRQLSYDAAPSLCLALLFAAHPAFTQSVAWIPGVNDSLLAAAVLGSFIFFLRFAGSGSSKDYCAHLLLFSAALFVKESAVLCALVFPLALLLFRRPAAGFWRQAGLLVPAWAAVIAVFIVLRHHALQTVTIPVDWHFAARDIPRAFEILFHYIGKIFYPVNLSVMPGLDGASVLRGIVLTAAAAPLLLLPAERRSRIVFGIAWFTILLAPSFLRLVQIYNDQRIYLSALGFCIVLQEAWQLVRARRVMRAASAAGTALALALFAQHTWSYADRFMSRLTLWQAAAATAPENPLSHIGLANIYLYHYGLAYSAAQEIAAIEMYRSPGAQALLRKHRDAITSATKDPEALSAWYRRLLAGGIADRGIVYYNYGMLLAEHGRPEEAEKMLKESLKETADRAPALTALVEMARRQKRYRDMAGYARQLRAAAASLSNGA